MQYLRIHRQYVDTISSGFAESSWEENANGNKDFDNINKVDFLRKRRLRNEKEERKMKSRRTDKYKE